MNDLERLGQTIQEHTEQSPRTTQRLREVQTRLEMSAAERTRPSSALLPRWAWVGIGALACVALIGVMGGTRSLMQGPKSPLSVTLESQATRLVGSWVVAGNETKQLSFSDGTSVSLHPHTKLRVVETTATGGTIDLGKGRTLAQIKPIQGADWRFRAGPFSVRVTGTEFDLAWDPGTGVLELALHQGSVMLSGPTVAGEKPVRKGQFVRVELPASERRKAELDTASVELEKEDLAGLKSDRSSEDSMNGPSDGNSDKAFQSTKKDSTATATSSDKSLLSNNPKDVLTHVDKLGSQVVFRSASAQELWSVARAARLGGRPELARDSLLALRTKHGTRGETSYLLGKVHADQLRATSEAISWFETYLKEAPGGPLAEQATGRLVELQAGTLRGRSAAKRYLELYPSGAYADFSRSQLR
jgi:hypothetical protein